MKRTRSLKISSLNDHVGDSLVPKSRITAIGCRLKNGVIVELSVYQAGDGFHIQARFGKDVGGGRKGFSLEHIFNLDAMPTVTITREAFADISGDDSDDMMSKIVSATLSRSCRLTLERIRSLGEEDTIRIDLCSKGYASSADVTLSELADFLTTTRLPGEPR